MTQISHINDFVQNQQNIDDLLAPFMKHPLDNKNAAVSGDDPPKLRSS